MLPVIRKFNIDPVNRFGTLSPFNRLFDDVMGSELCQAVGFGGLDMYEDDENLHVDVELPGFGRDEIQLTLEDGVLHISAKRKEEKNNGDSKTHYYIRQRATRQWSRDIQLPVTVEGDKVEATFANGLLCISMEKTGQCKPHTIAIN